jgi:hypothetical protein
MLISGKDAKAAVIGRPVRIPQQQHFKTKLEDGRAPVLQGTGTDNA